MNEDFVTWDDDFSVGFAAIDNQHKDLVLMVNELFKGCERGAVAADMAFLRTIRKALEYAKNHFADEEKYMAQSGYPNLNEHKKQHEDFVVTVIKATHGFEAGETAPLEMARFLKDWLLNHIAISDKQYAPYLAKLQPHG